MLSALLGSTLSQSNFGYIMYLLCLWYDIITYELFFAGLENTTFCILHSGYCKIVQQTLLALVFLNVISRGRMKSFPACYWKTPIERDISGSNEKFSSMLLCFWLVKPYIYRWWYYKSEYFDPPFQYLTKKGSHRVSMVVLIFVHTRFEVPQFFVTLNPNYVWVVYSEFVVHDRGFLWYQLFVHRIWFRGIFTFFGFLVWRVSIKYFSRARMASFIWIRGFSYRTTDSCLVLFLKVLIDKGVLRERNLLFGADVIFNSFVTFISCVSETNTVWKMT